MMHGRVISFLLSTDHLTTSKEMSMKSSTLLQRLLTRITSSLRILHARILLLLVTGPTANEAISSCLLLRLQEVSWSLQTAYASRIPWDDFRHSGVGLINTSSLTSSVRTQAKELVSGSKGSILLSKTQITENPEESLRILRVLEFLERGGLIRLTLVRIGLVPLRIEVCYEVLPTKE